MLSYFMSKPILNIYCYIGMLITKLLNGEQLKARLANYQIGKIIMFEILDPSVPLPHGYKHVYDHYFRTQSVPKPLSQSKPNSMRNTHVIGRKVYLMT